MSQEFLMILAPVISTLLINIFMLVGILAAAYIAWRELFSAKKEGAILKKDAEEKAAQIISSAEKEAAAMKDGARGRADQILAAAESAANNVIQKSNLLGTQFQESLKKEFQKTLDAQISAYQAAAKAIENKTEESLGVMEREAKTDIKKSLEKFGKALADDEAREHEEIKHELQKHRDQQIAEMDEYAKAKLSETISHALGDALTKDQHEALVLAALKKLKETNFFQHV